MLKNNGCIEIPAQLPISCDVFSIKESFVFQNKDILNAFKNFSHRDKVKVRKILKTFRNQFKNP